jgi:hypothetical protein
MDTVTLFQYHLLPNSTQYNGYEAITHKEHHSTPETENM